MKNSIIAILIGALILFVYQAMAWMVLPVHANSHKYTTTEDSLLAAMSGLEEGVYYLPGTPPNISKSEAQQLQENNVGKPWAMIYYHETLEMNMAKSMGLGFLIDLIAVALIVQLIRLGNITGKGNILRVNMLIAFIIIFTTAMMNWNWFSTPWHYLTGEILDQLIGGLLLGLWLGFILSRKPKTTN